MQALNPPALLAEKRGFHKKTQYTLWFLVIVASILGSLATVPCQIKFTPDDYLTIGSFAAIGVYCLAALYLTGYRQPFSLNCTHWVFVLFFLAYAPVIQFLTQDFPGQADIGAFNPLHLETNGLILAWCFFYSLTYKQVMAANRRPRFPVPQTVDMRKPNYTWLILLCLFCTGLSVATVGFSALVSRNPQGEATFDASTSPLILIVQIIGRACPLPALALILITGRRHQAGYYVALVCTTACLLVTSFPLAIARFAAGAMIIGLICIGLRRRRMTTLWLVLVFWLGFIVAMPFLNLFRWSSVQEANASSYQQGSIVSIATGGDFDAYMMFVATIHYGQRPENITMGRQLLGSVLFFVPRSLWPDKPLNSGGLVVQNTVLNFYNLSSPMPAEGYVNFGVAGVILFAIGFGWIVAALDKSYWASLAESQWSRPNLVTLCYPFLVGYVIIIMRGPMLAIFSFTTGFVVASWLTLKFAYLGSKINA